MLVYLRPNLNYFLKHFTQLVSNNNFKKLWSFSCLFCLCFCFCFCFRFRFRVICFYVWLFELMMKMQDQTLEQKNQREQNEVYSKAEMCWKGWNFEVAFPFALFLFLFSLCNIKLGKLHIKFVYTTAIYSHIHVPPFVASLLFFQAV